ncbi:MAG: ORF6N domain-containing protein [Ignavibacteriaceae bacterium]|nr:ORF6N domain-containing protein [Ignavibacteriaceae bacterium]
MEKISLLPPALIETRILFIRGQKVIIDSDLAKLYGVTTKRLNEQVKRNKERFPLDFMIQLTIEEKIEVVANCDHLRNLKYSPNLPFAFSEHGTIMLASVLNSQRAVDASVYVVRAFVRLREVLATQKEIVQKLTELENKYEGHDEQIREIIEAINQLLLPPEKPKSPIGFLVKEPKQKYRAK